MIRWLKKARGDELRERRRMIREGELLPEDEFRRSRGVTPKQLARLVGSGSIFSIDVDGSAYYPRLLIDRTQNFRRLAYVCRILWPAPPNARLDFLISPNGALGNLTPLQALKSEAHYRELLRHARGWASEFSRTVVKICDGEFIEGATLPVVCTGVVEIDPRASVWRRAAEAVEEGGNLWPDRPYPRTKAVTVLVSRSTAGNSGTAIEARLDVILNKSLAHTSVLVENFPRTNLCPVRVDKADDVVAVVRKILQRLHEEGLQK